MGKMNAWKWNMISKKQASLCQKNLALKTGISTIETLNAQIPFLSLEANQTDLVNYKQTHSSNKISSVNKTVSKTAGQTNTTSVKLFMPVLLNPH